MSHNKSPRKFEIPVRTSSKRTRSQSPDKSLAELEEAEKSLSRQLKMAFKRVKTSGSFDLLYWRARTEALDMKNQTIKLRTKISMRHFERESESNEDWKTSDECRRLTEEAAANELHLRLAKNQADVLDIQENGPEAQARADQKAFVKLYVTSLRGLNLSQGTAERDRGSEEQSQFRRELIEVSCAANPNARSDTLWCHITNMWIEKDYVKAAHIISYKHGSDIMDAIFGREQGTACELFSPLNGLVMWEQAEGKFDQGFLVIVPDLEDGASATEVEKWHARSDKGYKIRVVNQQGKGMNRMLGRSERTWNDLDNQVIQFRSSFRPRSRYLYFHYLTTMLRRAWTTERQGDALKDQLGKRFWGTPGPYLRSRFLKGFVTEVGHVFEEVVQGGATEEFEVKEAEEVADLTAVGVAAQQIMLSHEIQGDNEDDEDDESEEEEFQGFGP